MGICRDVESHDGDIANYYNEHMRWPVATWLSVAFGSAKTPGRVSVPIDKLLCNDPLLWTDDQAVVINDGASFRRGHYQATTRN